MRKVQVPGPAGDLAAAAYCIAMAAVLAFASASCAAEGPVTSSLRHLRFSPDGRYVLAQDDTTVTVLSVQPFAVVFQAPAQSATLADFTPDSHQILFASSLTQVSSQQIAVVTSPAHVERWSIADRARIGFTEISLPACGTMELSPDGSCLACDDLVGVFHLYAVASGATVLERKYFGQAVLGYVLGGNHPDDPRYNVQFDGKIGSALIAFSTDGRYLVAVPERSGHEEGDFVVALGRARVEAKVAAAACDLIAVTVGFGDHPLGTGFTVGAGLATCLVGWLRLCGNCSDGHRSGK